MSCLILQRIYTLWIWYFRLTNLHGFVTLLTYPSLSLSCSLWLGGLATQKDPESGNYVLTEPSEEEDEADDSLDKSNIEPRLFEMAMGSKPLCLSCSARANLQEKHGLDYKVQYQCAFCLRRKKAGERALNRSQTCDTFVPLRYTHTPWSDIDKVAGAPRNETPSAATRTPSRVHHSMVQSPLVTLARQRLARKESLRHISAMNKSPIKSSRDDMTLKRFFSLGHIIATKVEDDNGSVSTNASDTKTQSSNNLTNGTVPSKPKSIPEISKSIPPMYKFKSMPHSQSMMNLFNNPKHKPTLDSLHRILGPCKSPLMKQQRLWSSSYTSMSDAKPDKECPYK